MNEYLALDVGTGTVIGFLGRSGEDGLEVLARSERRYPRRAVEEGRIVDVYEAAQTVKSVAAELCEKAGVNVNEAHFAIPGRGLEISKQKREIELEQAREITADDVQKLHETKSSAAPDRLVVDESVLERKVDGAPVENFKGQYGSRLEATWLLNTLSVEEVENKKKVIEKAGLVPGRILLEPRAAVLAGFPEGEFGSRLGLVDFGAGTIDAAILEEGKIKDFSTFLGSGDKLTRRLQDELLVDFERADSLKKQLTEAEEVSFENLAGETETIARGQVIKWLNPVLREELQPLKSWFEGRLPELLFLAGGGSQFPNLARLVARTLGLDEANVVNRVPARGASVSDPDDLVASPADYTGFGILVALFVDEGRLIVEVTVNGETVRRLARPGEFDVGQLVNEKGFAPREPHPDSAIMFSVDGEWMTEKSDRRLKPLVRVNGEQVDFRHILRTGDRVEIMPPEEPSPARARAGDYLPDETLDIQWKDSVFSLKPYVVDEAGEPVESGGQLEDGGEYEVVDSYSRSEILEELKKRGCEVPDRPLWKLAGTYTRRERFDVGEEVQLQPSVNPVLKGLGNLDSMPPEKAVPLNQPLN